MPDGGRLRTVGALGDPDGVVITVQDEGIGIAPEELDGLFQPFHGTFAKGSGLGLAIVHRIVTDYHGADSGELAPGTRARRVRRAAGARGSGGMNATDEAESRRPPTERATAAHSRGGRRAVDARTAGDRAAARRLRGGARRERPCGHRRCWSASRSIC